MGGLGSNGRRAVAGQGARWEWTVDVEGATDIGGYDGLSVEGRGCGGGHQETATAAVAAAVASKEDDAEQDVRDAGRRTQGRNKQRGERGGRSIIEEERPRSKDPKRRW